MRNGIDMIRCYHRNVALQDLTPFLFESNVFDNGRRADLCEPPNYSD